MEDETVTTAKILFKWMTGIEYETDGHRKFSGMFATFDEILIDLQHFVVWGDISLETAQTLLQERIRERY